MKLLNLFNLVLISSLLLSQNSRAFTARETVALSEFLGGMPINDSLEAAEQDGKLTVEMKKDEQPWGGYYWADGFGGIASPWHDPHFPQSEIRLIGPDSGFQRTLRWLKNHRGDTLTANVFALSDEELNNLSPSEKYDLLFSNTDFTLTHAVLGDIEKRAAHERLAPWEGICNGWSLASMNIDRPVDSIKVRSFSGREITFFPHDLTALVSLLYARSPINNWNYYTRDEHFNRTLVQTAGDPSKVPGAVSEPAFLRFLGQRCNRDGSGCGSLNPALMHLALVNSIGYHNSAFIMDKHKGLAIGNVAVFGYEEKLYHPNNGRYGKVSEAISTELDADERAPGVVSKIGVVVTMKYRKELKPSTLNDEKETHYWDYEDSNDIKFSYVLYMDAAYHVVDGKWAKRWPGIGARDEIVTKFPSFLWKLPVKSLAFSGNEGYLIQRDWSVQEKFPEAWTKAAEASSKLNQPLGVVVYNLIAESRKSGRHQ